MTNTTKKATKNQTAAEAYAARTTEIETLMREIAARLDLHRGSFKDTDCTHWGYVGDLAHYADKLREIAVNLGMGLAANK